MLASAWMDTRAGARLANEGRTELVHAALTMRSVGGYDYPTSRFRIRYASLEIKMNGNGDGNSSMSSNSALTLEVLVALVIIGIVSIIFVPALAPTVATIVLTALVGILNNLTGVKSGGKMPEQAGDAKPGESSQRKTTSEVSTQAAEPEVK